MKYSIEYIIVVWYPELANCAPVDLRIVPGCQMAKYDPFLSLDWYWYCSYLRVLPRQAGGKWPK